MVGYAAGTVCRGSVVAVTITDGLVHVAMSRVLILMYFLIAHNTQEKDEASCQEVTQDCPIEILVRRTRRTVSVDIVF